jgi:hypothetical protein
LGDWSPERPVPTRGREQSRAGNECMNETRKRKRPARTSPGEAQLFTVSILHSARFFSRVKQICRYQQNGG